MTESDNPKIVDLQSAFEGLTFLPDRTPGSGDSETGWAARPAEYRDGAVFVVHYAGSSQWEVHPVGDEFVMVVEGATTMTMIIDGADQPTPLGAGQFVIVPQGVWHRFDTPDGAKILTITPQPTDHQLERPV